jgi:hypothetical protein
VGETRERELAQHGPAAGKGEGAVTLILVVVTVGTVMMGTVTTVAVVVGTMARGTVTLRTVTMAMGAGSLALGRLGEVSQERHILTTNRPVITGNNNPSSNTCFITFMSRLDPAPGTPIYGTTSCLLANGQLNVCLVYTRPAFTVRSPSFDDISGHSPPPLPQTKLGKMAKALESFKNKIIFMPGESGQQGKESAGLSRPESASTLTSATLIASGAIQLFDGQNFSGKPIGSRNNLTLPVVQGPMACAGCLVHQLM